MKANRFIKLLPIITALLLLGCSTGGQPAGTATPDSGGAPATDPPSSSAPDTSDLACPPATETYRNDVLGIALAHAPGQEVLEPDYLGTDYGVILVDADRQPLLQIHWLFSDTRPLATLVEEELAEYAESGTVRAAITVGGVEGVMLSPVPGEVANTAVYLTPNERLIRLLYPQEALNDAGRCLLQGLTFYPPTQTLDSLGLTPAGEALNDTPPEEDLSYWALHHDMAYGFSFRYPAERWTLATHANDPNLLSLVSHEGGNVLHIKVARAGEDVDLQLYGGAAGDFTPAGTTLFLGEEVDRSALAYEDLIYWIFYNGTSPIPRGDLLFSLALVNNNAFESGMPALVPEAVQAEAERILGTFMLD